MILGLLGLTIFGGVMLTSRFTSSNGFLGTGFNIGFFDIIILAVLGVIIAMMAKRAPKLVGGLVIGISLILCIFTSVNMGLNIHKDINRVSAVYGESRHVDIYKDFTAFDLKLDDVVFYPSGNAYVYNRTFMTRVDFDGTEDKFNLLVNDQPAFHTHSAGGIAFGLHRLNFYDLARNVTADILLEIRFEFWADRVAINITSRIDEREFGFLKQYVQVEGIHLRLIEQQHQSAIQGEFNVTFDIDGVKTTQTLPAGSVILNAPSVPVKHGYTFRGWSVDGITIINPNTYLVFREVTLKAVYRAIYGVKFEGNHTLKTSANMEQATINLGHLMGESVAGKKILVTGTMGIWSLSLTNETAHTFRISISANGETSFELRRTSNNALVTNRHFAATLTGNIITILQQIDFMHHVNWNAVITKIEVVK
jgi:hypothetical protein